LIGSSKNVTKNVACCIGVRILTKCWLSGKSKWT